MTFLQWVYRQRRRQDSVGAFATMATTDKAGRKPRLFHRREDWVDHLAEHQAPTDVVAGFEAAWSEWAGESVLTERSARYCKVKAPAIRNRARQMVQAFSRQTGWRVAESARACPATLVGKRHNRNHCDWCETYWLDHAQAWRDGTAVRAIVFHPYDQPPEEFWDWCSKMGLDVTIWDPHFDWYYPGQTYLCVITRAGDLVRFNCQLADRTVPA